MPNITTKLAITYTNTLPLEFTIFKINPRQAIAAVRLSDVITVRYKCYVKALW